MDAAEMAHYSRALDEVWRLRKLLAYEAQVTDAHLSLRSFPKSRRAMAEHQVERMRAAARGESANVMFTLPSSQVMKYVLREAGAESELLTRHIWESS